MAKSPEMKILERFVGTWDLESKTIVPTTKAKEAPLKGVATVEWALGDRFIQYRCRMNGWEDLQLTMFDAGKKIYRHWNFNAEGVAVESTRECHEEGDTTTWHGDLGEGRTEVLSFRFTDRDTLEWRNVVQDGAGQVVSDRQGKMTRRGAHSTP
jgi:hypothetical protein